MTNASALPHYHFFPATGLFGDPIPFYWQGEYHLFFQYSPGGLDFNRMHWGHIRSHDLLHWEVLPDALAPEAGGVDACGCWTGSVLAQDGVFHIFYTGCAEPDGGRQTICHASSRDLLHWQKDAANPLLAAQAPFASALRSAWRDPCVYPAAQGGFGMALTAEAPGAPACWSGLIAAAVSADLSRWHGLEMLYAPGDAQKMECPDYFDLDGQRVLLYSDFGVQVRRRAASGDWLPASPAQMDGFRFYAAKTLLDGAGRRICFGFLSSRRQADDASPWSWGGVLALPRQLNMDAGGRLFAGPVAEVLHLRKQRLPLELHPWLGNWSLEGETLCGRSQSSPGAAAVLLGVLPAQAEVCLTLDLSSGMAASVLLACSPDGEQGYRVEINPALRRLALLRLTPGTLGEPLLLETVDLPQDLPPAAEVRIFVDGSALEVFLAGRVSLSTRIYPAGGGPGWWGVYTARGALCAPRVQAWSLGL